MATRSAEFKLVLEQKRSDHWKATVLTIAGDIPLGSATSTSPGDAGAVAITRARQFVERVIADQPSIERTLNELTAEGISSLQAFPEDALEVACREIERDLNR